MSTETAEVKLRVGSQWIRSSTHGDSTAVFNPSTGKTIARTPVGSAADVDAAVTAARDAFDEWAETPVVERARVMFAYRELIARHFDELARLVTREHGKTYGEARAEVQRGLEMVEFACSVPTMISGDTFPQIAENVDGETNRHPLGVCVGITPYNFPNMVPLWMFPIAITCGNTFVLKPSEKVPLSAVRLVELLIEAGLPDGVINLVHGGKEVVDALLEHERVAAISFVGSTQVAKHVYQTGTAAGKRVQAAGGAKNHLIIMPDADIEQSAQALAASAFGCAGQRCMAGSVAIAVGSAGDPLLDRLLGVADRLNVAPTDNNDASEMGPVISADHRDRVAGYLDTAGQVGAKVVLDGRDVDAGDSFLLGPSIVDQVTTDMPLWKEEIFGPLLSVVRADSLQQALAIGKTCPFGNGASIFTRDGYAAREFKRHFNAGMIGINVGVPAPMAWLPFTGWNESFFGDLHIQGTEGVHFYTRQKMTLTRWFQSAADSHHDPVWKSK
ncbi:Methylmalonate-semialdehyde dehydrogenase [acylating] [Stieleria maiorica]|uniref:methylmalonate-semialdehyde dehydrogenase (CoA acylating) n=1 Tax=Stieleria maiorica TaxID=2795974 RepID=A0A5B9M5S0_9BACT|nr:CoA-acylating methylmalonate-semialdehyde dehydrogenase [Stieleria maiorica]QEF96481.1 Methylmalonate-semialdehyde dehydrogenase [acylating] [Stieleria maiorica]